MPDTITLPKVDGDPVAFIFRGGKRTRPSEWDQDANGFYIKGYGTELLPDDTPTVLLKVTGSGLTPKAKRYVTDAWVDLPVPPT
jgi:hypothetical protein